MVVRLFVGIERNSPRNDVHSADRWSGGLQLSSERVVVGVFAMVRLRVRVSRGADGLEIGLGERRLVLGQRSRSGAAAYEDKEDANAKGKAKKFAAFH